MESGGTGSTTRFFRYPPRWPTVEGCAEERGVVAALEAYARVLPYVEIAVARVRSDPAVPPPYEVLVGEEKQSGDR